jgi:hypothetical protein
MTMADADYNLWHRLTKRAKNLDSRDKMSKYCQLYVPDDMVLATPLSEGKGQQLFLADAMSEYPSTDNQYPEVAAAAELVAGGWLWNAAENTWVPPVYPGWRWEEGTWVQEEEDAEETTGIGGMWSRSVDCAFEHYGTPSTLPFLRRSRGLRRIR